MKVPIFYCESGVCYYFLQWNVWFGMFFWHVANKRLVMKMIYLTLNEKSDIYSKNDIITEDTVTIIRAKMAK